MEYSEESIKLLKLKESTLRELDIIKAKSDAITVTMDCTIEDKQVHDDALIEVLKKAIDEIYNTATKGFDCVGEIVLGK